MITELSKRLSDFLIAKYRKVISFWLIFLICLATAVAAFEIWQIQKRKLPPMQYWNQLAHEKIVYPLLTTWVLLYLLRSSFTMIASLGVSSVISCLLFYLLNFIKPVSTSFNNVLIINLYIVMMNLNSLKINWDTAKQVPCTTTMNKLIQSCLDLSIVQIYRSSFLPISVALAILGLSPILNSWTLLCVLIIFIIHHLSALSMALSIYLIRNEIFLTCPSLCCSYSLQSSLRMIQKILCKGYVSFLKYIRAKKGVDARYSIYVPLFIFSLYTIIASVKILISRVGDQFINDLSNGSILLKNFAIIATVLILFSPFPSVGFMSNRQWNLSMFGIILLVAINTSFVIYAEIENDLPSLDLFESFFLVLILVDGIYRIFMYVPNSRIGYHSKRKFQTIELVTSQRFAPLVVILLNVSSQMSLYKNWLIMSIATSTAIFSDLILTPAYFLLYENLGVLPDVEDTSTSNDNYPSSSVRSQDPDSVVSKEQSYSSSISQGVNQKRSFCVQTSDIRRASMPVVIQHKQFSRNKKSTCSSQISNSTLQLGQENERNGSVISSSSVTETIEEEPIA